MKSQLLIIYLVFASLLSYGQENETKQFADFLLEKNYNANKFAGIAAGVSRNDSLLWKGGEGHCNIEKNILFTPETKTRIASLIKPMTAVAIMQLYEQGKIDLDVPIQRYVPEFPKKEKGDFTTRQLMEHTAGIPSYKPKEVNNEIQYDDIEAAVAIFQDRDLVSYPGEEYHYTSYGYVLLGRIIEKISGINYEDYMQKNIWDPAGMTDTGIEEYSVNYTNKSLLYTTTASGYFIETQKTNLSDRVPGGGVYSTVDDLLKFGEAILSNKLISAPTLEEMLIPITQMEGKKNYGLGWSIYNEKQGFDYAFGHSGSQRGAASILVIIPDQQACIIALSNTSGTSSAIKKVSVDLYENLLLSVKE